MKQLTLVSTFILLLFSQSFAQPSNTQKVHEHYNIATDLRNGEVLTFLTYTLIMNHEKITRVSSSGTIDFSTAVTINGVNFIPWGATEIGNQIVMSGAVNSDDQYLVCIDRNGNLQWAQGYTERINAVTESSNGDIIWASIIDGNRGKEFLIVEVAANTGHILNHKRTELPSVTGGSNLKVISLLQGGIGYLALFGDGVRSYSITSTASLQHGPAFKYLSNDLGNIGIREMTKSVNGDFNIVGVDEPNAQFFFGRMNGGQEMTSFRRVVPVQGNYSVHMAQNGPVSVESPNRYPYYHGGSWGSVTMTPGFAVLSFIGTIKDANDPSSREKAVLYQFDQFGNLHYAHNYNFGSDIGNANLVKRHGHQITMVNTLGISGSIPRLVEYRLEDDFIGCYFDQQATDEGPITLNREELETRVGENELDQIDVDENQAPNPFGSAQICPITKTEEAQLVNQLEEADPFRVYPNPSSGSAFVKLPVQPNTQIRVMDMTGRTLLHLSSVKEEVTELSGLTPGVYIVSVQTAEKVYTRKLIVQ